MILGPVTLSDHLILSGLESASPIAVSARRTLGGRSVVQSLATPAGRLFTLQGENHFSLQDLQDVQDLAAINQAVSLVHARGTFTVLITAVDPEPAWSLADPESTSLYSATITLQEV